jgi:hypothetical protein
LDNYFVLEETATLPTTVIITEMTVTYLMEVEEGHHSHHPIQTHSSHPRHQMECTVVIIKVLEVILQVEVGVGVENDFYVPLLDHPVVKHPTQVHPQ